MQFRIPKDKNEIVHFLDSLEHSCFISDETRFYKLRLVLEELLTNSLNHICLDSRFRENDTEDKIEIDIENSNLRTHVIYRDPAHKFDMFKHYESNRQYLTKKAENFEEGGLGLMLILQFASELKYFYDEVCCQNIIEFQI